MCGATVIDNLHLLTAAHCLVGAWHVRLVLGEHDRTQDAGDPKTEVRPDVEDWIMHPEYNQATYANDIALIVLSQPLDWSTHHHIRPVCLPPRGTEDRAYDGKIGVATGWGKTHVDGSLAAKLQEVGVSVYTQVTCRNSYSAGKIEDTMLCAGLVAGKKDACKGNTII